MIIPVLTPVVVPVTYSEFVGPTLAGPATEAIIPRLLYVGAIAGVPTGATQGNMRIGLFGVLHGLSPTLHYGPSPVCFGPGGGVPGPPGG